ncbi:hypothetical protein JX265_011700 [Neoarthrinium moseri]|uniref:Protein kinase domain-containing protein n=1 Tax=Neoarthrinium moseri TaxID=1658444 RepID=A0A9P9WC21_9PEZI|nr:uncharacterized protein JN550_013088 [Neoarthrinium moseri]KAI1841072.1 hypothetical protein JX266_012730 [Neoarthrinium moseri]KAI1856453.1 hypothetical protein JX265_011700 [Neoarthrinium moseri]KAI1857752.1 hypothetical protein JN550_013088 [Neoarthrinium moseri]
MSSTIRVKLGPPHVLLKGLVWFLGITTLLSALTNNQICRHVRLHTPHHPDGHRLTDEKVLSIRRNSLRRVQDSNTELRVRMDDGHGPLIKYVSVDANVLAAFRSTDEILSMLPPGNWNKAYIFEGKDKQPGVTVKVERLLAVEGAWSPLNIDYFDLIPIRSLKTESAVQGTSESDFIQVVSHPLFSVPIVMKIASFPNTHNIVGIEAEIVAYRLLEGAGVAPRYLGQVTENGRVIGFLTEYIANGRTAQYSDRKACLASLSKVHSRGIVHRDPHLGNCIIGKNGEAYIVDYETSRTTNDYVAFQVDYDLMWQSRGG